MINLRCFDSHSNRLRSIRAILPLFTFALVLLCSLPLSAQKKKEKEEVTKYDKANAEYLFIEAQKFFLLEDYERALAFLDQSLEVDNSNHAAYFKKAEIYFVTEKYDRGLKEIDKAISMESTNKYYYLLAARLYKAGNDLANAAKQYELMVAKTRDYKEFLLDMVDVYVELGQLDKAISTLELTEKEFNTPDKFMFQKKELLVRSGKVKEATSYIEALLKQKPDSPELLREYSALMTLSGRENEAINYLEAQSDKNHAARPILLTHYLRARRFSEASPLLNQILQKNSLTTNEKIELADELLQLNQSESQPLIKQLLDAALHQSPNNVKALELQGELITRLSNDKTGTITMDESGFEVLLKLKETDPSNFQNWKNVLTYEFDQENWELLIRDAEESLGYFPNQGLFYFYLASASLYKNELDEVEDLLDQASRLSFSNDSLKTRIYGKLGELKYLSGNPDEAKTHFEEGLSIIRLPEIINNYSLQLALQQLDKELALELANELTAAAPDQLKYVKTKAFVLFHSAQYAQARQVIEEGMSRLPGQVDGSITEQYGDILIKLDLVDEAVAQWQKAKALGNTSDKLDQKIANKEYFE